MNYSELWGGEGFFLIAGPCAVENEEVVFQTAEVIKGICTRLQIPLVFKASYRKANRTNHLSFRGIGDEKALQILNDVKSKYDLSITTDIHESHEAAPVSEVVDILQIPAFLCRQTTLIQAAAETGKAVNIKKGQFMSAESMAFVVEKVRVTGNENVILTERGNSFGYGDLIVDFRNIPIMQKNGCPVVLDCTHANQRPNQSSGITDGASEHIATLAKAGVGVGVNGLFIETHPNPSKALSDGSNMLPLEELEELLIELKSINKALINA